MDHMRSNGMTRVVPAQAAEENWVKLVNDIASTRLWNHAKSWYTGANIPGKVIETQNFTGGVPLYNRLIKESADRGFEGFVFSGAEGREF